jgi:CBS domain-containing protein
MLTVAELMNSNVVSVEADASIAEAAARMVRARVGSAIVLQGSLLVGILTERDVLRVAAFGGDLSSARVSAWMTKDPQSARPDMSVDEAARLMMRNGFRHLPVVDGREIRGVISQRELFAARIKRPQG